MKLCIDLVPKPLHQYNLRSEAVGLGRNGWEKLRKSIIAKRGSTCAICGSIERLHVHERWDYVVKRKSGVARLIGLEIICERCHFIHHWGLTELFARNGKMQRNSVEALIQHFMNVNHCSRADFDRHKEERVLDWEQKNKMKWRIDWGEFEKLIKEARKGKGAAQTKVLSLEVPCANCSTLMTISFPPQHFRSQKSLGILYVCNKCGRGGRMELPPGSMGARITKGAHALFSADINSAEWKAEVGGS